MARIRQVELDYQTYIAAPPVRPDALYSQSTSNDKHTIDVWRETWIRQIRANHASHGPFAARGVGQIWNVFRNKPCIVAGSGPSLKYSLEYLADAKRNGINLISCLHNFHFMHDNGITPDYYVTLDAGPVTIEEISEGGKLTEEEYWAATEKHTLIAYVGSHPDLLKKWRGEILFFNCGVPDEAVLKEVESIEMFHQYVSTGGNVLGASMYIAKAFCGANPIIYVGADFCFENSKFHSWDSKYDVKMGHTIPIFDVFGNKKATWPSYANFKAWFDWVALNVPGIWINCTEGGALGAYADGNILAIRQMDLKDCIRMYSLADEMKEQAQNPGTAENKILF